MSNQNPEIPSVLKSAWQHFADYDHTSRKQRVQYLFLRGLVLFFSIVATALAILLDHAQIWFPDLNIATIRVLQATLILILIIGSVIIVSFLKEFRQGQKYRTMRAGAEEILRAIYIYRTILQNNANRDKWLNGRLTTIQQQVYRSLGDKVVVKPNRGQTINPHYAPDAPDADEGIADLNGSEYMRVRLESQLVWYIQKIQQYQRARTRFAISIISFGALGAFFTIIDLISTGWVIWVALTTAIFTALINWQDLRGIDAITPNYSKVILELNMLRDHWLGLRSEERTQAEFFKMARKTEEILGSQHQQFIRVMKDSIEDVETEQEETMDEPMETSQEIVGRVQDKILEEARNSMEAAARAAASEQSIEDDERLPANTIFTAALGPVRSVIVRADEEDAPDGFETQPEDKANETQPKITDSATEEEDDPMLAAINSAVDAAIQESEAVKSANPKTADKTDQSAQRPPESF